MRYNEFKPTETKLRLGIAGATQEETMAVEFNVRFETSNDGEQLYLLRIFKDGSENREEVDKSVMKEIEEDCKHLDWRQSGELGRKIGSLLFQMIDGEREVLTAALNVIEDSDQRLRLNVTPQGAARQWPFELLFNGDYLVPSRVDLVRRAEDGDDQDTIQTRDRPLRMLFMACSPAGLEPALSFEDEEDALYRFTDGLPIHIDVEDSGSLEGLEERLKEEYDVIHLSGHADIDREDGTPFFWMENDIGEPVKVTANKLAKSLSKRPPTLLFLSGCRTGQAPDNEAAYSFSRQMVLKGIPAVLGWGLPVSDTGATITAQKFYRQLSSGNDILSSLHATRRFLFLENIKDWCLLRLETNSHHLDIPFVKEKKNLPPKVQETLHKTLEGSQVKVLQRGFVGRRRQIQESLKILKRDNSKIGLLIHGTGGLGKSCLAGKLCERLFEHKLIIVHGMLTSLTLLESIKKSFWNAGDNEGLGILEQEVELPNKLKMLCNQIFKNRNYLILLDDFEQNLPKANQGDVSLSPLSAETLKALLIALPDSDKETPLIITSRYQFSLPHLGANLIPKWLHPISPDSFRGADLKKKIRTLRNIHNSDKEIQKQLIDTGRGNPRLLEILNTLVKEFNDKDIESLLEKVWQEQEDFIEDLMLQHIIASQPEEFNRFLCHAAVFFVPVSKRGLEHVCHHIPDWETHIQTAVRLSLMEATKVANHSEAFCLTPLLREELFNQLPPATQLQCHQSAVQFYYNIIADTDEFYPLPHIQLIKHAVKANMPDEAVLAGGPLLHFLEKKLAYQEALQYGNSIRAIISEPKLSGDYSLFWSSFGSGLHYTGNSQKAIEYFELALSTDKRLYGENNKRVVPYLNNLGSAFCSLGDYKKGMAFYEQVVEIETRIYGERHPELVIAVNNLGETYKKLGDYKKSIEFFQHALGIIEENDGEQNPNAGTILNNLGSAYHSLGENQKAIDLFKRALDIDIHIHGERHPTVSSRLSNLGLVYHATADYHRAIEHFKAALEIDLQIYGKTHPMVAVRYHNLGYSFRALGKYEDAITFYEESYDINKHVHGENHPAIANDLNSLGVVRNDLGEYPEAIEHFQQALSIYASTFGERHPDVAASLHNVGLSHLQLGQYKKAEEFLQKAYNIDIQLLDENHPIIASHLDTLGGVYSSMGKYQEAINCYEEAIRINRSLFGEEHPNFARALNNLGESYFLLGKHQKALDYSKKAYEIFHDIFGSGHPVTKQVKENYEAVKKIIDEL